MYNYIIHKEKEKQKHHIFHTISIHTMETNVDEYNPKNEFFFNKQGKVRMENLHQIQSFCISYDDIWLKFKPDFEDNCHYIKKLIQSMVGEVFKIRPFPTKAFHSFICSWWERYSK